MAKNMVLVKERASLYNSGLKAFQQTFQHFNKLFKRLCEMCFAQKDEFITISKDAKRTHTRNKYTKRKRCAQVQVLMNNQNMNKSSSIKHQ